MGEEAVLRHVLTVLPRDPVKPGCASRLRETKAAPVVVEEREGVSLGVPGALEVGFVRWPCGLKAPWEVLSDVD